MRELLSKPQGRALLAAPLAVVLVAGCGSQELVGARHTAKPRIARNAAPAVHAPAVVLPADDELTAVKRLQVRLCQQDPTCCVGQVMPAGTSAQGRALSVVTTTKSECLIPESAAPIADEDGDLDEDVVCEDYWFVSTGPDQQSVRNIGNQCGSPQWEIYALTDELARTFTYGSGSIGKNDQQREAVVIGLDPLRLVAASDGTLSTIRHDDVSWNWDTFEGVLGLGVGYCLGAEPPDLPEVDSDAPTFDFGVVAIPRIALPAEFLDGAWRDVGLGRCSARIGGSQGSSVLRGTRASDEDAQVRVVLSATNELFVELEDDRLVAAKRGWLSGDHLEIWAAVSKDCVDSKAPSSVMQWGVGVLDGRVHRGYGRPATKLSVQTVRTDRGVRMRVDLGKVIADHDLLTLAYSDSDDGVRPKSVFATSPLQSGKWWTLGAVHDPSTGGLLGSAEPETFCAIESGTLTPRVMAFSP